MSDTVPPTPLVDLLQLGVPGYYGPSHEARATAALRVLDGAAAVEPHWQPTDEGVDPRLIARRAAQLVVDVRGDLDRAIRKPEFVELVQDAMGLRPRFVDVDGALPGQKRDLYIPDVDELLPVVAEAQRVRDELTARGAAAVVEREPSRPLEEVVRYGVDGCDELARVARARAAARALDDHARGKAQWAEDWISGEVGCSLYPVPEPVAARLIVSAGGDLSIATRAAGFFEVVQRSMHLHPHDEVLVSHDGAMGGARFSPTPVELFAVEPEAQRVRDALVARGDMHASVSGQPNGRELEIPDPARQIGDRIGEADARGFVPLPRQQSSSPSDRGAQGVLRQLREKLHHDSAARAERLGEAGLAPRPDRSAARWETSQPESSINRASAARDITAEW
jgi:hypothetical protein